MAVGEHLTYERDSFRLDYPAEWVVHENRPVGVTEFYRPGAYAAAYPTGVALMTIPETGMALAPLIRTGLFFLTRDLHGPTIERLEDQRGDELTWLRLLIRGRAPLPPGYGSPSLDVVKHVALARPGSCVLALALFGPVDGTAPLEQAFEALRRSVRMVR